MTKPKAYYQAYLVLECLSEEEYNLIPQNLLDEITSKMEKDDSIKVDSTIPLDKQKLDDKTYDILDRVIRAIERAYGKDAIDHPSNYGSNTEKNKPKNNNKTTEKSKNNYIDQEKDNKKVKELEAENIKLKGIIDALEAENKKIETAKELFLDYKEIVARKDQKISDLIKRNEELAQANDELHSEIERLPKLIKRIFIKDRIKKLK